MLLMAHAGYYSEAMIILFQYIMKHGRHAYKSCAHPPPPTPKIL